MTKQSTGSASSDLGMRTMAAGALACVIGAVWLATRPYYGIIHDSRLYTVLGLRAANPNRFDSDLFMHFGSQDRFTVFSLVYEPLLAQLGPAAAAMSMTVIAQACWLAGAFWLSVVVLRDRLTALAALIVLIVLPSSYGSQLLFSAGEPFVTPRLFAEAAAFGALGFLVKENYVCAACGLLVAGAFHPIMTAPVCGVFLVHAGARDARWYAAAAAALAACLGLVVLGIEPFARLMVRLDPDWLAAVMHREGSAFLLRWSGVDAIILTCEVGLTLVILRLVDAQCRRLMRAVLIVAAIGLGMTFAGADLLHNELLINLQFWRATWLLGTVSHLLVIPAMVAVYRERSAYHWLAPPLIIAGTCFLFVARFSAPAYICAALLLIWAAVFVRLPNTGTPIGRRGRLAFAVAGLGVGALTALLAIRSILDMPFFPDERSAEVRSFVLCAAGVVIAAWLPSAVEAQTKCKAVPFAFVVGLLLLGVAIAGWDRRTAWSQFTEGGAPTNDNLAPFLAGDNNIYWDGGLELLWFRLKRPSYYSCSQGAGGMFFRGNALTFVHRLESFRFDTLRLEECRQADGSGPTATTEPELRRACVREPALDSIILPSPVLGLRAREWTSPVQHLDFRLLNGKVEASDVRHYYRYGCSDLR